MKNATGQEGTVLAFDYGTHRLGVAVGETVTGSARPLATLRCRDGTPRWEEVTELIRTWVPVRLVVGLPRRLDGSDSDLTRAAQRFANRLAGRYGLPVVTAEEQLTSVEAEGVLAGDGRRRKDKGEVDKLAAALILESHFAERAS